MRHLILIILLFLAGCASAPEGQVTEDGMFLPDDDPAETVIILEESP